LEENFLPEGNFGLWREIWKEIGRKYCYKEGNKKEILFYFIISKNKVIFTQFCAKNAVYAVMEHLQSLSEVVGTHVVLDCKWIITVFFPPPPPTPCNQCCFNQNTSNLTRNGTQH
jgi:hypothetical protein